MIPFIVVSMIRFGSGSRSFNVFINPARTVGDILLSKLSDKYMTVKSSVCDDFLSRLNENLTSGFLKLIYANSHQIFLDTRSEVELDTHPSCR